MKLFFTKLKSQRGAMDKILVTLLLVIIGVAAVVGMESWVVSEKNDLQNSASSSIDNAQM